MKKFKLWLDCDGVLADFDHLFEEVTGVHPRTYENLYGSKKFWKVISDHENFFGNLPLMKDAQRLYDAVKHYNPPILTGVPHGDWAPPQKLGWRDRYFPEAEMFTCPSRDKYKFMVPDMINVLIDDWPQHKAIWELNGGIFIRHSNYDDTIRQLKAIGVL